MPYSGKDDVETWGQLATGNLGSIGYNYENTIQKLVEWADHAIDDYCDRPYGFFDAGGVTIQREFHGGVEIGDYGLLVSFGLSIKRRPFLRLDHSPVLSVASFEEETSADTWTSRTEGRGNDYLVMDNGVRFIRSVPKYDYKNVRVTYNAGYATTPGRVNECSGRLAAALGHKIVDSKTRSNVSAGGVTASETPQPSLVQSVFNRNLKGLVRRYKRHVPVVLI